MKHPIPWYLLVLGIMGTVALVPIHVTIVLDSGLADWVGAVGSAGAFIAFVILWWIDRLVARADKRREEKEHFRRLISALRAEIELAIETANGRQFAINNAMAAVEQTIRRGGQVIHKPPSPDSLTITDGIIYRSVASSVGTLPQTVSRDMIQFYGRAMEIERIAMMAATTVNAFETMKELLPRVRMNAALLIATLDRLESADFDPNADLTPTPDEVRRLAAQVDYPLEDIMKERGLG